ncbi:MAG: HNH endonuclease [Succinivibrio sp.]
MDNIHSSILLCKVSYNWYQVIKSHFISNGSGLTNCWYTPVEELEQRSDEFLPPSGSLTLFLVEKDGKQLIVGGGFYLFHTNLTIESCWNSYGVLSGYITYQDFMKRAKDCKADLNDPISCYISDGSFIFIRNNIVEVPDDFKMDFENRSRLVISCQEPLGMYLGKICFERRSKQIDAGSADSTWPGIYYVASLHKSAQKAAQFRSFMINLYHRRCAVSGCSLVPILNVAHIKTIYDERYTRPCNGLILRSDIHKMFSKGLITFYYDGPDVIRVRVSENLKYDLSGDYKDLEGKALTLPDDRTNWPSVEYLEWHNRIRFENWLKYGEFSLIDTLPMHPKE